MADEKPYDSAFKTLAERNSELLVPLVNEVFGTAYPEDAKVVMLRDEHHVREGKEDERTLDTDALFDIEGRPYHIECQSTPDGIIAVRMVEYGFHIAMDGARRTLGGIWEMRMPQAAVLYLRHNRRTPEAERVRLILPDGSCAEYSVPIIKVQLYELEELFRKKLLIMLPFYLFRYEKQFAEMEKNPGLRQKMLAELKEIEAQLEALRPGRLGYAAENVSELVGYVGRKLMDGYEQTSQEVADIMGGKLIETRAYKAYLEGEAKGEANGETRGEARGEARGRSILAAAVKALSDSAKVSVQVAMDMMKLPQEQRDAIAPLL